MGKKKDGVILPVAPDISEMAVSYPDFINALIDKIQKQRISITLNANAGMIDMYWSVGNAILKKQDEEGWGTKVIDRISHDIKVAFPDMSGFSPRNIKNTRRFAAEWPDYEIVQQVVAQIPWGQNIVLLDKVSDDNTRRWYAEKTIENGWTRNVLTHQIESNLYTRQVIANKVSNFENRLPSPQSEQQDQPRGEERFSAENITAIVASAKQVDTVQTLLANSDDYAAVLEYLKDETTLTYTESDSTDENGKKIRVNNRNKVPEGFDLDKVKKEIVVTQAQLDELAALFDPADNGAKLTALYQNSSRLSDPVRSAIQQISLNYSDSTLYRELRALNTYGRTDANKALIIANSGIDTQVAERLEKLSENIYFMGINLGEQPKWEFNELIVIPIIAFVFSMAQMMIQQYLTNKQNPELAQQQNQMKFMFLMMPFISLFIVFSVPAGAGFYWSVSYLFGILQSLIMYKFWPSDKIRAEAQAKMEAKFAEREQRATVVTVDAEGNTTEKTERVSKLTQKEIKELNRKKLEAARRADAEKYGEEYKELPEDDDI